MHRWAMFTAEQVAPTRNLKFKSKNPKQYMGIPLMRNCATLGPCSRTMPRALRQSWGGGLLDRRDAHAWEGCVHVYCSPGCPYKKSRTAPP